jgi:hypothetical protein
MRLRGQCRYMFNGTSPKMPAANGRTPSQGKEKRECTHLRECAFREDGKQVGLSITSKSSKSLSVTFQQVKMDGWKNEDQLRMTAQSQGSATTTNDKEGEYTLPQQASPTITSFLLTQ